MDFIRSKTIFLIGNGNVAQNIADFFVHSNINFCWFKPDEEKRYFLPEDELEEESIYFIAVNEPYLPSVLNCFKQKNKNSCYGHFSGSISLDIFPELIREKSFVLHPMQTFPSNKNKVDITKCTFSFQGDSTILDEVKTCFQNRLTILPLSLKSAEAYHLMGVFASNFLPALMSICNDLGKENGLTDSESSRLILPLMKETLKNLEVNSLYDSLSGPLKRNATQVIENHELFLKSNNQTYLKFYQLCNQILSENILQNEK